MQEIKVVNESLEGAFADMVNSLLAEDWKLHSSSCGFVNSENYDFCNSYQAILVRDKPESEVTRCKQCKKVINKGAEWCNMDCARAYRGAGGKW